MASTQKAKIPVGFVIAGKYRVTGELGRGGMASVYEAENVDIGKRVAIKVLAQELTSSAVVVERFLREARAVAAIRSPYICDVYDSGRLDDGRPFLVLELLEGESLYEQMVRVGQIDIQTTVTVLIQACRGLTRAHAAGIVHRDLKPENIFVTKDEEGNLLAKILDFGLAKFYQPVEDGAEQARLTREGAVFGTPAYMSPEQVRGQGGVDARADLWALGCIAYESLTGRTVWSTDQGVAMTFAQIAQGILPDPVQYRPDLPEAFLPWFKKALAREIGDRFQTPKEFADELQIAMGIATDAGDRGAGDRRGPVTSSVDGSVPSGQRGSLMSGTSPLSGSVPSGPATGHPSFASSPNKLGRGPEISQPSPPPATTENLPTPSELELRPKSSAKPLLLVALIAALTAGGYFGYRRFYPPAQAVASSAPVESPPSPPAIQETATASSSTSLLAVDTGLPFRPVVASAQELIAKGDLEGARVKLKEAAETSGHTMPATMLTHLNTIKAATKEPNKCTLTGLGRPRTYDLLNERVPILNAGRPAIAVTNDVVLVSWTEADIGGGEQAYAVTLDEALRTRTMAFPVTPEAQRAQRPELIPVADKFLVSYFDGRGPEAGVYMRYLDQEGRIASGPKLVAKTPAVATWPTVSVIGEEQLLVTWAETTSLNTDDLYGRLYNFGLEPTSDRIRLTAFKPGRLKVTYPFALSDGKSMHMSMKVERDTDRIAAYFQFPLEKLPQGVEPDTAPKPEDKLVGPFEQLNMDRSRADVPTIACTANECYVAWNEEGRDGVWVAKIKKGESSPIWKQEVVKNAGRHPALAIGADGRVQLFWYEKSKLMTGTLDGDGRVNDTSVIGRINAVEQPTASVAAGRKPGEWFISWLDYESKHLEVYVARTECK